MHPRYTTPRLLPKIRQSTAQNAPETESFVKVTNFAIPLFHISCRAFVRLEKLLRLKFTSTENRTRTYVRAVVCGFRFWARENMMIQLGHHRIVIGLFIDYLLLGSDLIPPKQARTFKCYFGRELFRKRLSFHLSSSSRNGCTFTDFWAKLPDHTW